ncbi:MAG TPA: M13 family peptidase, partial [Phenylobacterium sp.]
MVRFRLALLALVPTLFASPPDAAPAPRNLDLQGMDRTVRPGDDFYAYANGAWLKTAKAPEGAASWGPTDALRELNRRRVRDIVAQAAAAGPDPLSRKVGDYYAGLLDEAGIEAKGLAPLTTDLAAIDAIGDRRALAAYLGATLAPE